MSLKSKLTLRFLLGFVVFGALLFIPAGTFKFWQGWAYLMVWFFQRYSFLIISVGTIHN